MTGVKNGGGTVTGSVPVSQRKNRKAPLLPRRKNHPPKRLSLGGLSFGHGQTFRRSATRRKRHLRHLIDKDWDKALKKELQLCGTLNNDTFRVMLTLEQPVSQPGAKQCR
ncbi:hypothetical protein MRX96_045225 [Rhipicephalus microplus]